MATSGHLTQKKIGALNVPGRYGDGDGLYIRIAPTLTKSWVLRIMVEGKRRDIGLGGWPKVSLKEARLAAQDARTQIAAGTHRIIDKIQGEGTPRFQEEFYGYIERNWDSWKNEATRDQWIRRASTHLMPDLGPMRVDRIRRMDIVKCLERMDDRPAERRAVHTIAKQIFQRVVTLEIITRNPATNLEGAMTKHRKHPSPYDHLSPKDAPEAYRLVGDNESDRTLQLMIHFQILTAARPTVARLAVWSEIDVEMETWTISAERMKSPQTHRVPLSRQALEIIEKMRIIGTGCDLVFAKRNGQAYHNTTAVRMLRRQRIGTTAHGFRHTFRTWAAQMRKYRYEEMEYAMAHRIPNLSSRPYVRTDLLEERRPMMQAWADFVTGEMVSDDRPGLS